MNAPPKPLPDCQGTHIDFYLSDPSPSGKTKTWIVYARNGGQIGIVRWFGRWRCYVFEPHDNTVFEQVCMRELAQFIEHRTQQHARELKARKVLLASG